MTFNVDAGGSVNVALLHDYFRNLVNRFFKILPIRESEEPSLQTYMQSLQAELLGMQELIPDVGGGSSYLTLLSILQYLIDNPECTVREVKREVFNAISVCNKLKAICIERYSEQTGGELP